MFLRRGLGVEGRFWKRWTLSGGKCVELGVIVMWGGAGWRHPEKGTMIARTWKDNTEDE